MFDLITAYKNFRAKFVNCHFVSLQLVSIITDETPIEQMRNRLMIKDRGSTSSPSSPTSPSQPPHHPPHTRKPKLALLREVFGRGGFVLIFLHRWCLWFIVSALQQPLISVLISCFLQGRSFAGFFLSTPALRQLAASPTPPFLTTTFEGWRERFWVWDWVSVFSA